MTKIDDKTLAEERTELAGERTRLAAERTFNSWIRTGLAGVGGGLAIMHLLFFENPYHRMLARWMGQFLILWGGLLFLYALYGYHRVVHQLSKTLWPLKMWVMSFIALSMTIFSLLFFLFSLKF